MRHLSICLYPPSERSETGGYNVLLFSVCLSVCLCAVNFHPANSLIALNVHCTFPLPYPFRPPLTLIFSLSLSHFPYSSFPYLLLALFSSPAFYLLLCPFPPPLPLPSCPTPPLFSSPSPLPNLFPFSSPLLSPPVPYLFLFPFPLSFSPPPSLFPSLTLPPPFPF